MADQPDDLLTNYKSSDYRRTQWGIDALAKHLGKGPGLARSGMIQILRFPACQERASRQPAGGSPGVNSSHSDPKSA